MNTFAEEAARIVELLPAEKARAVVDYARSLADSLDAEEWNKKFSDSKHAIKLNAAAADALAEFRAGETQPLDPDQM